MTRQIVTGRLNAVMTCSQLPRMLKPIISFDGPDADRLIFVRRRCGWAAYLRDEADSAMACCDRCAPPRPDRSPLPLQSLSTPPIWRILGLHATATNAAPRRLLSQRASSRSQREAHARHIEFYTMHSGQVSQPLPGVLFDAHEIHTARHLRRFHGSCFSTVDTFITGRRPGATLLIRRYRLEVAISRGHYFRSDMAILLFAQMVNASCRSILQQCRD